jgi:hypothetical protein
MRQRRSGGTATYSAIPKLRSYISAYPVTKVIPTQRCVVTGAWQEVTISEASTSLVETPTIAGLPDVKRCCKNFREIMTSDIRRADLRAMQSGLRKMKANIATTRGFGEGPSQSAADR